VSPDPTTGSEARDVSTKEVQDKLLETMKRWQKIEDASVASTGRIIEQTDNPIIRMIAEIIQHDSQIHHRVQEYVARTLESAAVSLSPDDLVKVWDGIAAHIELEKEMVGQVTEALAAMKGKKMMVQEYLLTYLQEDEQKHNHLLENLEKIKKGMYPYG
jgi:hypothetical protein